MFGHYQSFIYASINVLHTFMLTLYLSSSLQFTITLYVELLNTEIYNTNKTNGYFEWIT